MSMNIPLNLNKNSANAGSSSGTGLRLNLPINFGSRGNVTSLLTVDRQIQILRAVAAAASLLKASDAVKKAKQAKESLEDVIEPNLDDDKLNELILAVKDVQDNPSHAGTPSAEQIAAARAIGAKPALVHAAFKKMEESEAYLSNGMAWVAAVDGGLLDLSAREGAKRLMLDKVPVKQDLASLGERIEQLESKVQELEQQCRPRKPGGKTEPVKSSD